MCDAVFLAVARDAEIQIGIAQLRGAADRKARQRFVYAARVRFKPPPPGCHLMAMRGLTNNFGTEKYEIIRERCYERSAIRIRIQYKSQQQERGENPG